jgi:crotonobetainyl-CoA:carnitine CoA-transferase CaiB-like acyl-CoA transferase
VGTALKGIKVLDLSRIGPGPYCSMLLADFGADVTLIEPVPGSGKPQRPGRDGVGINADRARAFNAMGRGKRSVAINLKDPTGVQLFQKLARTADVVIEGFRPGVVQRLGVDYATLSRLNQRIICCSISGYGQTGPYRDLVGHDINYIAVGAALGLVGPRDGAPAIPLNILADYAGGGLMAAFAICVAVIARERTGRGQEIDLAMSDGVLSLLTSAFAKVMREGKPIRRGEMLLNGGAPFYNVYRTRDGRWLSVGCLEPYFYDALCDVLGIDEMRGQQMNEAQWPELKAKVAAVIASRTADEWMALMSGRDIAAASIVDLEDVAVHPHHQARQMVIQTEGPLGPVPQIGVAPKLSETPGEPGGAAPWPGRDTNAILDAIGCSPARIQQLRRDGIVA